MFHVAHPPDEMRRMCHVKHRGAVGAQPAAGEDAYFVPDTNRHRAVTLTVIVCSPGLMGVGTAALRMASIFTAGYGTGGDDVGAELTSSRSPSSPPAPFASASASPRARPTAAERALRRASSWFDAQKSSELIVFAPLANTASRRAPSLSSFRT